MLARDAKHSRISSQIALIESELAQLTVVEMGKRALRLESEMVSPQLSAPPPPPHPQLKNKVKKQHNIYSLKYTESLLIQTLITLQKDDLLVSISL